MNAPTALISKSRGALRNMLGLEQRNRDDDPNPVLVERRRGFSSAGLPREAQSEVLDRIKDLFLSNELALTPENLLVAHAAFSGSHLRLGAKIAARQLAGEASDHEWLDSMSESDDFQDEDQGKQLEELMASLDASVARFGESTREARTSASHYNCELQEQVDRVKGGGSTEALLSNLASIASAMLERTREIERQMNVSERDAKRLRLDLERARKEAEIDHLTDLPNRRAFERLLESEYQRAQTEIDQLSVAFCDIDHFKRVNDTFGHETGDRVIKLVADVLRTVSREKCSVARHGGEEFVMVFRGLSVSEAQQLLDEARQKLSERHLKKRETGEPLGKITFSGGVADVFAYDDPRTALRAADEALYLAKETGRNQILAAQSRSQKEN